MTKTQLRRMIRIESELIAIIGSVVGLLLAAITAQALSAWAVTFTIPWTTLGILLVGAFAAGTIAGVTPARRAARMDPSPHSHTNRNGVWAVMEQVSRFMLLVEWW